MRLSTILLIILLLFVVYSANAQEFKNTNPPGTYYSLDIRPSVILCDSIRCLTPRDIFFKYYPRVTKDNYDCWASWFGARAFGNGRFVDVRLMDCEYTFEELKQYLFYEK